MGIADFIKTKLPYWPNWFNYFLLRLNVLGGLVYGRTYNMILMSIDKGDPEKKLLDIVNFAICNVPYYRKKYGTLQIHSLSDFEQKIGFIDKEEVMAHWDDFLVDNIDWTKAHTGTTGGTSGKPLKLVEPLNRYAHSLAFTHKQWMWFGWRYDARGVFRNHHISKDRDYIISPILKEIIFDPFRMDAPYASRCWKALKKYHIRFVHAYPSSFYQFCKLCVQQGLKLDFIRVAFLASEGVTEEQRVFFDEIGIAIYSFYGHSEKLILAGNSPESALYYIEENYGYCELVDNEGRVIKDNGVTGEMVGTTFCNKLFPLIRYKTGDYSRYAHCTNTKYGVRCLDGVQGRWDRSLIYKADGTYVNTATLNLHSHLYSHIDGLQYIQEEVGRLIVCIIKNERYTSADEQAILTHYVKAMGSKDAVEIRYVDKLIFQTNGKFLQLVSKIQK